MVGPNNGWLRFWIRSASVAVGAAIVATGCASPQAPSGADAGGAVQPLGEVSVSRDGDGSVVYLDGLVDPVYSLSEESDEKRVVVDLVGVGDVDESGALLGDARQVAAYDGVVDMVTFSTFADENGQATTRVEIELTEVGRAQVSTGADGLEIRIEPGAGDQAMIDEALSGVADAEGASDGDAAESALDDSGAEASAMATDLTDAAPMADATTAEPWNAESPALDELQDEPVRVIPAAKPATLLTGLSAQAVEGGVVVGLEANGSLDNVEVFTLEKPARLVFDVQGIKAAPSVKNVRLDSPFVTAVRMGAHDGKLRIVVDGGSQAGDFAGRQMMPGATGMYVAIGAGEALAQALTNALDLAEANHVAAMSTADALAAAPSAMAEAQAPMAPEASADAANDAMESDESLIATAAPAASPAATAGATQVYGLSFERLEKMDRTAILADGAVTFTTYSPDPDTLVVLIPNARISEDASDRLFPEQGGPVSMVHAFQQPDLKTPEVRVVFNRAANQKPVLSTHGSTLFVDFENLGVAAAAPPAFPGGADAGSPPASAVVADQTAASESPAAVAAEVAAPESNDVTPTAMAAAAELFSTPAPESAEQASAPAAVEVPAAIEVLEEGGLIDGKEYRGRRVSLDFKDVAIADVLRLIAEVSDLNIIAGDEVSGDVTIRLVEVPWDQALDVILMTKGLGFVRVGNVLRIAPADVLKAEEEVRLQERRNKEKLEDLEVKLLPVNYAKVKDIEGLVRRLLSARGTVNLDERTNTLIIKDISSVIDEATALVGAVDTQTPQVMIEAKIVEANLDFSRELGSVWSLQTQQFEDPFDPDTLRTDLGSEDFRFIDDNHVAFGNPITAVPTGLMTIGALILDEDFRVDAQIQAAEATGDGKVVSSPRIVTLDNKEATIKQGVSIPFQTFEGGDAKLEFIDAVLSLIVTPHITADESIIMQIEVTRNAPDDSVQTPTGSPAIAKNVAETQTLVKDGQTLVLGGIYTINKSQRQSRVPYLHRIPVVGNLFKNNEVTDQRKELLVFVTPRIVRLPEMAATN